MKKVIDVCCGGKHFWFDKNNPIVEFCDKRYDEDILLCNGQHIHITPDTICDFKNLPFENESFYLAVFDPPHLINKSENAWMVKKYGTLPSDWKTELKNGFDECMRVLKPNGILVFKWNETEIPTSEIIKTFGENPLFGHKSGKRSNTNWLVFMKPEKASIAQSESHYVGTTKSLRRPKLKKRGSARTANLTVRTKGKR